MRNLSVLIILITLIAWACKKDELSSGIPIYGKLEVKTGNNQSGYFGEFLYDTIILKASSNSNQRSYLIKFEMIQGNGNISTGLYTFENSVFIDNKGILKLNWKLGCNSNIQKIRFLLYVDSTIQYNSDYTYYSAPSDSLILTANGIKPDGWVRSCGCENPDTYASKIITYDKNILYLISQGLYHSTDNGLNWYKVEGIPNWEDIVDAQFNSKGCLYILTRTNGIYYSKDMKQWQYINNGILDHREPTAFLVEDSTLFVSFYFDGPYKTINNGEFWRKLLVGGDRYYCITRHPDGDIYLFDKWDDLWVSKDYGKLWEQLNLDYKYTGGIVYDLKIDKNGYLYIGGDDATLSVIDSKTYQGEIHKYYQWNSSSQEVTNIQITDDNVFYLLKGNPKPGIYSKLNNWDLLDIKFNKPINYYYLKADNTFMLVSDDGLYYYNKI